jgi:hypothetical protein
MLRSSEHPDVNVIKSVFSVSDALPKYARVFVDVLCLIFSD